jgi:choline dehydrogenase-like flavoprotein
MVTGKALGGSSRINGLLYTRSAAADFNRWSDSGRKGWSYNELEPIFKKSEGHIGSPVSKSHGSTGQNIYTFLYACYVTDATFRAMENAYSRLFLLSVDRKVRPLKLQA